jgi:predicted DNA-binding ribbon-helix-helix protein
VIAMTTSLIRKRSVIINGHKTSVSLEAPFWNEVRRIAAAAKMTVAQYVASIDKARRHGNLSSALRLAVLAHIQSSGIRRSSAPIPQAAE